MSKKTQTKQTASAPETRNSGVGASPQNSTANLSGQQWQNVTYRLSDHLESVVAERNKLIAQRDELLAARDSYKAQSETHRRTIQHLQTRNAELLAALKCVVFLQDELRLKDERDLVKGQAWLDLVGNARLAIARAEGSAQ